jgi:hypothetical protein
MGQTASMRAIGWIEPIGRIGPIDVEGINAVAIDDAFLLSLVASHQRRSDYARARPEPGNHDLTTAK